MESIEETAVNIKKLMTIKSNAVYSLKLSKISTEGFECFTDIWNNRRLNAFQII